MADKNKLFKLNPLLNPKNLKPIENWRPWEPTLDNVKPSDIAYTNYKLAEEKMIQEQEKEWKSKKKSNKVEKEKLLTDIHKARKHLSEAATNFADQVDFLKWVQKTVDDEVKKSN